ncbi:MAG: class I SAM-dependent methyltransferase [Acidimicrobiales bacterium]
MSGALSWNRQAVTDPAAADVVRYGPEGATEAELRLLGHVADKRVLELGCGSGAGSVALARQGARPIGLDFSPENLAAARRLAERAGVRVEFHEGDLADLAFSRADTVDVVFSVYALGLVEDVDRVFRQVHRVLKVGCPFVFSISHPAYDMLLDQSTADEDPGMAEGSAVEPLVVRRSYFNSSPINLHADRPPFFAYHQTVAGLFTGLTRANFRVDTVVEPEPQRGGRVTDGATALVPRTLIMRARKE